MSEIQTISGVKYGRLFGTSNFDNIINASIQVLNERPEFIFERSMGISDTPISLMNLDDDYTPETEE